MKVWTSEVETERVLDCHRTWWLSWSYCHILARAACSGSFHYLTAEGQLDVSWLRAVVFAFTRLWLHFQNVWWLGCCASSRQMQGAINDLCHKTETLSVHYILTLATDRLCLNAETLALCLTKKEDLQVGWGHVSALSVSLNEPAINSTAWRVRLPPFTVPLALSCQRLWYSWLKSFKKKLTY